MGSGGEAGDLFCIICTAALDYSKQWEINTAIDLRIQASIAHLQTHCFQPFYPVTEALKV